MKELFISDLDGTLLDGDARLPEETVRTINRLTEKGLWFTAATARSPASAEKILSGLRLRLPVIMMNGVLIRDIAAGRYEVVHRLEFGLCREIIGLINGLGLSAFMYKVTDQGLRTFYERLANKGMEDFFEERCRKYYKSFTRVDDLSSDTGDVIYFTLLDNRERLLPLYERLRDDGRLGLTFYRDIYNEELWYLEVFSRDASKAGGVRFLREHYGFDRVTAFGDNLNDIPLMQAADVRIAVENAAEELKRYCDLTVAANTENGVARYIEEVYDG